MPYHHGSHAVSIDGLLSWFDHLVEHLNAAQLHYLFEGAGTRRWQKECKRLAEGLYEGTAEEQETSSKEGAVNPEPRPDLRIVYSPIEQEALQKFLEKVDEENVGLLQELVQLELDHDDVAALCQIHNSSDFLLSEVADLAKNKSDDLRDLIANEFGVMIYGHSSVAELVEEIPW